MSPTHDDAGIYRDTGSAAGRNRMSFTSTMSEEKENGEPPAFARTKLSPDMRYAGDSASSGRGSPARGFRSAASHREEGSESGVSITRERPTSSLPQPSGGVESWKRAAEVTSQLKARIEQMKVSRLVHHHDNTVAN